MQKLIHYGIPELLVDLIKYWYANQFVCVKYMSHYSKDWKIGNGVRQGGVLSGLFFGIYVDSLLTELSKMNIGCKMGIFPSNILAYADDVVLLAPSFKSLQLLINKASNLGLSLDLNFNLQKTKCMIFRCKRRTTEGIVVSKFQLNGNPIDFVNSFKYLGFLISCRLNDDLDICRVRSKFYSDFNSMFRQFSFTDREVKLFLFKQYCLQMYGCELWFCNSCSLTSLKQFSIGYHKAIKKLLELSSHESNHYACQEAQLFTFQHFVNKCKILAAYRLFTYPCAYILKVNDFLSISSMFLSHVYDLLSHVYGLDSLLDNDRDALVSRISFTQNHEEQMRAHW